MKYIVISDIHGGLENLNKVLDIFLVENCDKILFLGDIPNYYEDDNENKIIKRLNEFSNNIIAVMGNCDEEINNLIFPIPIVNETKLNNKKIFMIHNNIYSKDYFINKDYDIILSGHTHVSNIERVGDKLFINPGSITKSRSGENSFVLIDEETVTIRNVQNKIISSYNIDKKA